MTVIAGVIGAAVLFGLFTLLRPNDRGAGQGGAGCTGHCAGCTGNRACETGNAGGEQS